MTPELAISRTALGDVMTLARTQAMSHRPMLDALRVSGVPMNADDPPEGPPKKDPPADPPKVPPVTGEFTAADKAKLDAALDAERKLRKQHEKDAKEALAKLKTIEDADASELEKATKRADEAEAANAKLTDNMRRARLTVELAKPEHALVDAAATAALITGVEFDEDGNPTNVADRVKAVTETYAFLKGKAAPPPPGEVNSGNGVVNGSNGPTLTAEELAAAKSANMSAEEWAHYKDPSAGPYVAAKT